MYGSIAALLRRLWEQGPFGRVMAVVVLIGASLGIGALRVGAKRAAVNTAVGCGLDDAGATRKASALLDVLEKKYGPGKPVAGSSGRRALDGFDVAYVSMYDPCYGFLGVRTPLATTSPAPPEQMMRALEDRAIGGKYERGLRGTFVYEEATTTFFLSHIVELKTTDPVSIVRQVEELRSLGESWRKGWFEEVALVVRGEAAPPAEHVYRPGKDPESMLREVDAFLKDAGQEGIYP